MTRIYGKHRAQVRKHTTVDLEDAELLRKKNIKIAHVVRDFCKKQRQIDSGTYEEQISSQAKKLQRLTTRLQKTFDVLGKMLTEEQFKELIDKI